MTASTTMSLQPEARGTVSRFGRQWSEFDSLPADYEAQFADWILPLKAADFKGKVVLDAGCGMGRFAAVAARWGAKRVVAVDAGAAAAVARKNLAHLGNVTVLQADLHDLPFGEEFDLAYSIGVIHHLPEPAAGLRALARVVRPGGRLFCWVYGLEGNEWITRWVDPVRKHVTSRLPHPALLAVSTAAAAALHPAARFAHLNRSTPLGRVPYSAYLAWLGQFGFKHTLHVIYDHLNPPIAYYLSRDQVEAMFTALGCRNITITRRNNNSWRALGTKPAGNKR